MGQRTHGARADGSDWAEQIESIRLLSQLPRDLVCCHRHARGIGRSHDGEIIKCRAYGIHHDERRLNLRRGLRARHADCLLRGAFGAAVVPPCANTDSDAPARTTAVINATAVRKTDISLPSRKAPILSDASVHED